MQELQSQNPMISRALGELEFLSQDAKTRQIYEERLKADLDYNSGMVDAFRRGEVQGKQEGILEGEFRNRINTAKTMVKEGFTMDQIKRITGLTKEDLLQNGILI